MALQVITTEREAPDDQQNASGKNASVEGAKEIVQCKPISEMSRTASMDIAALTGRSREVARAALDVVGDDHDGAYRLLMTDLALTVLCGQPCEIVPLECGASASLGSCPPKVRSVGAYAGCSLLRVAPGRTDDLRLFALEPVEICVFTDTEAAVARGWSELEDAEAPEVDGVEPGLPVQSCSFDPGPVLVPLARVTLALVRFVRKPAVAPPANTVAPESHAEEAVPEAEGAPILPRAAASPSSPAKRSRTPTTAEHGAGPEKGSERRRAASRDHGYQDERQVGSGSFGTVHLARDEEGRQVAIKRLKLAPGRPVREAKLLKSISHPCVVGLVDTFEGPGEDGGRVLNIVMEYLPQNLHQRINGTPLDVADFRCFSFQLLRALVHLDALRVCHRDVKPENVLLRGRALKLADFGSAKVLDVQVPSSSYICSRWWRAPELVLGASEYNTSVDWWSCGCVVAEMMLGRSLFMGASSWGQMYQIIRSLGTPSLEEVRALNPSCSGRMAEHLNKLAELQRPAKPWAELLPAFAQLPEALELPARLLAYDPGRRCRPTEALGWKLFFVMAEEDQALPEGIFEFTPEELGACTREVRSALLDMEVRRSKRPSPAQTPSTQASEGGDGALGTCLLDPSEPESSPEVVEAEAGSESCGYSKAGAGRARSRTARRSEPYATGASAGQQRRTHAGVEPPSPGQKRRRLLRAAPTPTPILVRLNTGDLSDIP